VEPLLKIAELHVHFRELNGNKVHALNGADLQLAGGEVLGILGESGCGKSTLARALMRLLPKSAQVSGGTIQFAGQILLDLSEGEMRRIRGAQLALILSEPGQSLNPVMRAGDQIAEVIHAHREGNWKHCRAEAVSLLERVHLSSNIRQMYDAYPHQLSGGQQQRVVIAQALACHPALIIADEPTASLDSTTASEILELLRELKEERNTSLLLITHDPTILPGIADRVAVMYGGRIVEDGPLSQVFHAPRHPYVKALLDCALPLAANRAPTPGMRLKTIGGSPPNPAKLADGCSFSPRCPDRMEKCRTGRPPSVEVEQAGQVECLLYAN
jgi:oligopeptide transport system ATP-binding protein